MGWIRRVLPTAAGPGIVVLALWLSWFAFDAAGDTRGSAWLLGAGLGTATSIIALPVVLIGASMARRWIGAIGFALGATAASRLLGLTSADLGPTSLEWEATATVGAFAVYVIVIALGYGVRTAARGDRAAVAGVSD